MKTNILKMIEQAEVEWKPLGEVTKYEQPTRYLVKSTNYQDDYETPVLTAGKTFILGYTNEIEGIYSASRNPVIIFDDFTTANKWVDFDFKVKSSAMKMITSDDETKYKLKYIYYWLNTLPVEENTDHKRQWISNFSNKLVPIPPLELQKEIVKRLDILTELEATLEATLEAELSLRKKQYQYYRNLLLTFDDISDRGGYKTNPFFSKDVVWKSLGEVATKISSGGTPLASRNDFYDNGNIPWLRTQEVKFNEIFETEVKITQSALENSSAKWIPANCVIIAISGATAGRSAINKIPLTTNQHCCNIEVNAELANYRYVFHWVSSQYENIKALGQGARCDLNSVIIRNYKIPIPPLETQAQIVKILDKFDRLTNSITDGLPKEIELRRKQYEYYRELLLGFARV